jgi:uncharacterized membrane protein
MGWSKRGAAGAAPGGILALALALAVAPPGEAGDGVVRVLLFSSPTCPHCQKVREEVLPALGARFGERLQVAVLSTSTAAGRDLYWAAFSRYGVQQRGVPMLVVGDFALVGSVEIPRRLPTIVEAYLAQGGVEWPPLPGLDRLIAASAPAASPPLSEQPAAREPLPDPAPDPASVVPAEATLPPPNAPTPAPVGSEPRPAPPTPVVARSVVTNGPAASATSPPERRASPRPAAPRVAAPVSPSAAPSPVAASPAPAAAIVLGLDGGAPAAGPLDRFRADPRGNGLALVVLASMVWTVLRSLVLLRRPPRPVSTRNLDALTPLLALAGLGVAAYLAHVEVREVEAVCGPVGDCNAVQQSEYARLFGVLPIGVLGVLGFAAVLAAWAVRRLASRSLAAWSAVGLLAMTGAGTLFSIYLTFLEPFVIGATCLWCLASAVIMTALYGLAHAPALDAVAARRPKREPD